MKIVITLLTIIGLVAASIIPKLNSKTFVNDFLSKQKFLFEIVYRIEDPLMFEDWIQLGKTFHFDKAEYEHFEIYMEKFYEAYKYNAILSKGEFFGALVPTHLEQANGLFGFFYYAKSWNIFQRNVAWARMHCNEAMFVYALNLAIRHNDDLKGLTLPAIYEIFPHNFFSSKFINDAEKFDYDIWSKYNIDLKNDEDNSTINKIYDNEYNYFYTKDFKTYQWWKLMGLQQQWYAEDRYILHENMQKHKQNLTIFEDHKKFFMPVDYTRDIEFYNKESVLSYYTEDVGLNAYWYNLNMDYAFLLHDKTHDFNKDRRVEYLFYNIRQLLARYYMERLSNGYGEIPELSHFNKIEHGYKPQLVYYNGVGYSYRQNYYEIKSYDKFDFYYQFLDYFNRLDDVIKKGIYVSSEGKTIDLHKPDSIIYIGSIMQQNNMDKFDKYFFNSWYLFTHMYFGDVNTNNFQIYPNIFLNYETMIRDPMFYMVYKKVASIYNQFIYNVKPYTQKELLLPGVTVKNVNIGELVTNFDLVDFDVTNLLNDKMTFVNGQFVWNKTLLGRQMRLNHKPFEFNLTVESDKLQKVVVRSYLGPKYDEFGRVISLNENRENFMEIDSFVYTLKSGVNVVKRSSKDFYSTTEDRPTYTELYKYVRLALEDKHDLPFNISEPQCGFPERLILPRGWYNGMPIQFFFYIKPFKDTFKASSTYEYSCGIGSSIRSIDELPFRYPFDREIDEYNFFEPNMFIKDAKIYHQDTFEKYYGNQYKNYGQFDYNYNN